MEAQLDVAPPALAAAYEDPPSHSGPSVLQRLSILEFSQAALLFLLSSTKTHSRSRLLLEAGSIFRISLPPLLRVPRAGISAP